MTRLLLLLAATSVLTAQPNLMPWPAKIDTQTDALPVTSSFRVALTGAPDPRCEKSAQRLIHNLARKTGLSLSSEITQDANATLLIHCEHAGEPVQKLEENESYRLEITAKQARLRASNALGIIHGLETFLQLVEHNGQASRALAVNIQDRPRFPWRGLHMDVCRHWMPLDVVKRNIDGMAAVKLNVFHWHLSDDQGFRVESRKFPKLHQLGSDGNYYTQDQVRDLIQYARDRGIRVVPEFDIPGHTTSWMVGYPELASAPGPYRIERKWGVFDPTMDPTKESTYKFLDAFIGEMAALFPDQFFHIGGDEVNGVQWKRSAHIRAFLKSHHLKDNQALQSYFNKRIQPILAKYGKRMEGWDEILDPGLPKDIVIQSWRGQDSLADAARLGYSGLLSHGYYLDHIEHASVLYAVDPLEKESAGLNGDEKKRILGGEVCMWAEYVSAENVDSRIWPRAAAIAERLWSPQDIKDPGDMYKRLEIVSRNLDLLGLTHISSYRPMLQRMVDGTAVEPLKVLADVLEPGNLDDRYKTHKYTQQTPLNRLPDALRPESTVARDFAVLVERMDVDNMRELLILWRDVSAKLKPVFDKSPLLKDDRSVADNLSRAASIGLAALGNIQQRRNPGDEWITKQREVLTDAGKLHAELRIAVVPAIQKLVDAAAAIGK